MMAILAQADTRITSRPMVDDDVDFLRHLYGTTRNDIARLPLSDREKTQLLDHQFQAQHLHYQRCFPGASFNVVLSGETRIGKVYVRYGTTEIRIIDIAIVPECRASGIGTRLMREVLDRATLEQKPVRLRVEPDNPAVHWYSRLGFKTIADERNCWHLEWNASEGGQARMKGEQLEPSFEAFESLLGDEISVQSGDQSIRFKLIEVSRLPPATTRTDLGIRQDPFSLLFKELTNLQPDQRMFTINTAAGTLDLFLVPVGFGRYEGIFN
jgi:ribosomal protein S18 acetylase RimI-like enzyme